MYRISCFVLHNDGGIFVRDVYVYMYVYSIVVVADVHVDAHVFRLSLLYELPTDWLVPQMRNIGLDVYVQNYTFTYPVSLLPDQVHIIICL